MQGTPASSRTLEVEWLDALVHLRAARETGVIVTVASVRGHVPRPSGAKMVVGAAETWGTVGGGNLEVTAVEHSRSMLLRHAVEPETLTLQLSDKAPALHGVQCCGGEVTLLLEPLPVMPSVAIFGVGHVGLELARILVGHNVELHLIDSRAHMLAPERLNVLRDGAAAWHIHHSAAPENIFRELPPGTHILIMTHDHAEDMVLCDTALRRPNAGTIGLIGSSAKWSRFRSQLLVEGHTEQDLARIHTPIGIDGISSKHPAAIAVSVAAGLLQLFESEQTTTSKPQVALATVLPSD